MGGGIAMAYANAGIPVLLKDVDAGGARSWHGGHSQELRVDDVEGEDHGGGNDQTLALITPTTSYDGFGDVDIVVEAVYENMDLKKATFAELRKVTRPDAILASNTSTLDIDELAATSGRPERLSAIISSARPTS